MGRRAEPDEAVDGDRPVDWVRLGLGVLRYAVGYAGALVVTAVLLLEDELVLVGLVGLGCFLLLLAVGGDRATRTTFRGSQADRLFEAGTLEAEDRPGGGLSRPAKYVLVGVGLIAGGVAALLLG